MARAYLIAFLLSQVFIHKSQCSSVPLNVWLEDECCPHLIYGEDFPHHNFVRSFEFRYGLPQPIESSYSNQDDCLALCTSHKECAAVAWFYDREECVLYETADPAKVRYVDQRLGDCADDHVRCRLRDPYEGVGYVARTGCDPDVDSEVRRPVSTTTPTLSNVEAAFGDRDVGTCGRHESYADCVNESDELCSWTFLTSDVSSSPGGYCRLDPVSECLRTETCVCRTEDFMGGGVDLGDGDGLLFHAPVSISPRDVSANAANVRVRTEFDESKIECTLNSCNDGTTHYLDDGFFISRVDFTARTLIYNFDGGGAQSAGMLDPNTAKTFLVKIHHLYMDTPLKGTLLRAPGLEVSIEESIKSSTTVTINSKAYILLSPTRLWTCSQLAITATSLYLADEEIVRDLGSEVAPSSDATLRLGPFSGEAFDVRVYDGTLSAAEVRKVGKKCATYAELNLHVDIETPNLMDGCSPDIDPIPHDGKQTYGAGAYAILWSAPTLTVESDGSGTHYDVPEADLDLEHYFQQLKVQNYAWERWYMETDMLGGVNLEPYQWMYESKDNVPGYAEKVWNNPCRFVHQHNNGWLFPFYGGDTIPKFTPENGQDVFDLRYFFYNRGWNGYGFVVHETFHGTQGEISNVYLSYGGRWLAESTASFGCDYVFPGADTYTAPYTLVPSLPLNYFNDRDWEKNPHFVALGHDDSILGGHIYGAFVFWSFLSNHVGKPHLVGKMYTMAPRVSSSTGELLALRMFLHSEGLDLGDVFANFVAHLRTWDYPKFGNEMATMEANSFDGYKNDFSSACGSVEDCKTTVYVDPSSGTGGSFERGPDALLPGPFGWNTLTLSKVASDRTVRVTVVWDDLAPTDDPDDDVHTYHQPCTNDERFFSARIVRHDLSSGARTYWKMNGKSPAPVSVLTGSGGGGGPVDVHVLLVPTPPADYVGDDRDRGTRQIPMYGYRYEVDVSPSSADDEETTPAASRLGVTAYDPVSDWFDVRCTCNVLSDDLSNCVVPTFVDDSGGGGAPTPSPSSSSPSSSSPSAPCALCKFGTSKLFQRMSKILR